MMMMVMVRIFRQWHHEALVCQTVRLTLTDNLVKSIGPVHSNAKRKGVLVGRGIILLKTIAITCYQKFQTM